MPPKIQRIGRAAALDIAVSACMAVLLAHPAPAGAIVGGNPASSDRWPWMAAVMDAGEPQAAWAQFCGGVVIAPRRVLTAAHCVDEMDAAEVDVLIGRTRLTSPGGRRLHVTAISEFPGYVDGSAEGLDTAVLTLASDAGTAPVALASRGEQALWAAGAAAWTVGWGQINVRSPAGAFYYADRLRDLQLPIVGDDACERAYGIGRASLPYRRQWSVCAGTSDGRTGPCYGDSGGPLLVGTPAGWVDVGVVTGGDRCAARDYFTIYARVDRVRSFALSGRLVAKPEPTRQPRVAGPMAAGRTVRCITGRWRRHPTRLSVTWARRGTHGRVISRGRTLRLSRGDARRGVRCTVTAANRGGRAVAVSRTRRG